MDLPLLPTSAFRHSKQRFLTDRASRGEMAPDSLLDFLPPP